MCRATLSKTPPIREMTGNISATTSQKFLQPHWEAILQPHWNPQRNGFTVVLLHNVAHAMARIKISTFMFEPVCVVKRDSHFSTQIPFSDTPEITEMHQMPAWKRPYCSCRLTSWLTKGYESFTITNVEECCMNPRKLLQPCPLWRRQTDHISNLLPQFESLVPLPRLHKFGATSHWKYIEIWRHHPLQRGCRTFPAS